MISKALGAQYDYLDPLNPKADKKALKAVQSSTSDWPDLEGALFEWQQRIQDTDAIITGDMLKAQAAKLWRCLPQYAETEEPKWSNGWLEGFQKRFKIKMYIRHGEAAAAATDDPENIQQMNDLCILCLEYDPNDILNMDETGLFWKMSPDRTLATKAASGGKKSKDRITAALTSNATGTDDIPVWIIGKSKNPRCLKNINRKLLGIEYRYNKSKWMTGLICEEYLRWLNKRMRLARRKVLLLMDNFSGHELAVRLVGGEEGLSNVRCAWLPKNTTSKQQPMDQGIIASFKCKYRRFWVDYMLYQIEAGKNPYKTVTLLKAIQWTCASQANITDTTVQRCWYKSTVIKKPAEEAIIDDNLVQEQAKRIELQAQVEALPDIEPLSIAEFIEPMSERIDDEDGDIFESVCNNDLSCHD